jgi:hypothetical protein
MKVKTREILTPAQNAQEALDLERERARPRPCVKVRDRFENQKATPEAVTVLHNEAGRRKAILSRQKNSHSMTSSG